MMILKVLRSGSDNDGRCSIVEKEYARRRAVLIEERDEVRVGTSVRYVAWSPGVVGREFDNSLLRDFLSREPAMESRGFLTARSRGGKTNGGGGWVRL